eukprot:GGOE01003762.1.p1 GENE.GGOE01003762.1~~GGOE01003762.1.p1  ORF type:complete len:1893 (-),score=391.49 GGOE01003762.1:61-4974(-)
MTAELYEELVEQSQSISAGVHSALGKYLVWKTVPLGDSPVFLVAEFNLWTLMWVAKFTMLGLILATPVFTGLCICAYSAWRHSRQVRELQEALAMSEDGTREFLSMFSHEMRTPLNHIIGVVPLLKGSIPESELRLLDAISTGSKALLDKINDVLDFAGMCAKPVKLAPETLHIRRCIDDIVAMYAAPARDKGLYMVVNVDAEVPTFVVADGRRLQQALSKLLSNAVKFTERGRIEVSIRPNPEAFGGGLEFQVLDSGVGMDVDEVPATLQPFRQLDMSSTRRFEGAGLGLFICQSLVKRWRGQLHIRAMGRHRGLEVTFTYPNRSWGIPLRLPPSSLPKKPVLVVSGCPQTNRALGNMLSWMDLEVTLLTDIPSLLDQLRRASSSFECVVLASSDFCQSELRVATQKLSVGVINSILQAHAALPPLIVLVAPVYPMDLRQLGNAVIYLKSPPQHADLWEVVTHGRAADTTAVCTGAEAERLQDRPLSPNRLPPRPAHTSETAVIETVLSETADEQPLTDASCHSDTPSDATNLSRAARERLRRKHFTKMTLAKGVVRSSITRVSTLGAMPSDGIQSPGALSPVKEAVPSPEVSPLAPPRSSIPSPTRNLTYPGMITANCGVVRIEDPTQHDAQGPKFTVASALAGISSLLNPPPASCGSSSPDDVRRCSAISASIGDSEFGSVDSISADGTDWLAEDLSTTSAAPHLAPSDVATSMEGHLELRVHPGDEGDALPSALGGAGSHLRPAPPPPVGLARSKTMVGDLCAASRTASPQATSPKASASIKLRTVRSNKSRSLTPLASAPGRGTQKKSATEPNVSLPQKTAAAVAPPPAALDGGTAALCVGLQTLVVDDVEVNRRLLALILRKMGCVVDTANDGLEACTACQTRRYGIVFMDCTMPNMDGWAATRAIRLYNGYHSTPILAVTALASEEDMRKCHDSGMDGVLCKPITPAMIQQAVAKWAPAQRAIAEPVEPSPVALDVPPLIQASADAPLYLLNESASTPELPRHALRFVLAAGLCAMVVVLVILAGLGVLLWSRMVDQVQTEAVGRVHWIAGVQTSVYNQLIDGRLQAMDSALALIVESGALGLMNHTEVNLNGSNWTLHLLPGRGPCTVPRKACDRELHAERYVNGSGRVVLTAPTADLRSASLSPSLAALPLDLDVITGLAAEGATVPSPYEWHMVERIRSSHLLLAATQQAASQAEGFLMDDSAAAAYTDIPLLRGVVMTFLPLAPLHAAFLQQLLPPLALTTAAFIVPLVLLTIANRQLLRLITAHLRQQRDWYGTLLRESAACLCQPGHALREALSLQLMDERLEPALQGSLLEMHTAASEYALLTEVIQLLHCPHSQDRLDPPVSLNCEKVMRQFLSSFSREVRHKGLEPLLTMSTNFPPSLELPQHAFQLVTSLALALALRHLRLSSPTLEVQLQHRGEDLLISVGDVRWRPGPIRRKANADLSSPVKARLKLLHLLLARVHGRLVLHPQDQPDACLVVCVVPASAPISIMVVSPTTASQDVVLLLTDDHHVVSECSLDGLNVQRASSIEELRRLLQQQTFIGTVMDLRHPAVQALDIGLLRTEFQTQNIVAIADEEGCLRARRAGFDMVLPHSFTSRDLTFAFSKMTSSPAAADHTTTSLLCP